MSEVSRGHNVVSKSADAKSGSPRRVHTARALRRCLPLGRAAVLVADGRHHVVGLADVSATGAFLITRARLSVGEEHLLKIMQVPGRFELSLLVRVVRVAQSDAETAHHPRGVAVQFVRIEESAREALEAFVSRGGLQRR
jgi:PilZ domain